MPPVDWQPVTTVVAADGRSWHAVRALTEGERVATRGGAVMWELQRGAARMQRGEEEEHEPHPRVGVVGRRPEKGVQSIHSSEKVRRPIGISHTVIPSVRCYRLTCTCTCSL